MPDAMIADRARLAQSYAGSQAVARVWRADGPYRHLAASFDGISPDDLDRAADVAEALLATPDWIAPLLAPLSRALADDPWFEPPLRVARDAIRIGAILFECPAATLTATVLSADAMAALPAPRTVALSGKLAVTRYVRGGSARLARWEAPPVERDLDTVAAPKAVALVPIALRDGLVIRLDGRVRGHLIEGATSDIVTLTFALRGTGYAREYALPDGALVRAAAVAEAESRTRMLLTFLRLSGRADAGDSFAQVTLDAPFHLRWTAMREWLALDALAALPRLAEMATDDPNREVRDAAVATLALVETRRVACPA